MTPAPLPPPIVKKPYVAPRLTTYGRVRDLTQAQSSGSKEGSQGSGIRKPTCERRLKEHVVRIGQHPLGIGLYLFDYKPEFQAEHGAGRRFGVMADEVNAVMPAAVEVDQRGYQRVDFAMLGITTPRGE